MSSVTSPTTDIASLLQRQQSYAQKSNAGLQDRGTLSERSTLVERAQQTITQNHGFSARKSERDALANNDKIINTRADQRGTIVNITA